MKKHLMALTLWGIALAIPVPALAMNTVATVMLLSAANSNSKPSCEQRYAQCIRSEGGAADPAAAVERMQQEWDKDAQYIANFEAQRKAEIKAKRDAERSDLEKQIADKWKDVKILRPN